MNLYNIASIVSEFGLIVHRNNDKNELYIARPASLVGTKFRGWDEDIVTGYSSMSLKTNAPSAVLTIEGKGRKTKFRLNISLLAAPVPGPVWIDEVFKSAEEVVKAVRECYFGDRINFKNESLENYFK
jgi:hypothetical protein